MINAVVHFAAPYRLPDPAKLGEAVVLLDIGFCADLEGRSFETITEPFIDGLGDRLKLWIDHHTHDRHAEFSQDERFVLVPREQAPACPELVTPERVRWAGAVDTIVCHSDFDGIASAAKFLLEGREPYEGCDADARAIDSLVGTASAQGLRYAAALAIRHDEPMLRMVLMSLVEGSEPAPAAKAIDEAAKKFGARVERTRQAVAAGELIGAAWLVDGRQSKRKLDRTQALLMAQKRAPYGLFLGGDGRLSLATEMSTPVDLPHVFSTRGGMLNRITLPMNRLTEVLSFVERLG
jgi:hypothetical protein